MQSSYTKGTVNCHASVQLTHSPNNSNDHNQEHWWTKDEESISQKCGKDGDGPGNDIVHPLEIPGIKVNASCYFASSFSRESSRKKNVSFAGKVADGTL